MSGAMVASLALPASAATPAATSQATVPMALAVAIAPSLAAHAPLAPPSFGSIDFTGAVKPKPKAKPVAPAVQRTVSAISRSNSRSPISTPSSSTQNAPTPAPKSSGILGLAASLAGIYYIYGGTTTAGFDCSGYTQYVFANMGIGLPRTAEQQRQATKPVTNPQPGDLVFFGIPAYHNGIYAGNGMMWDSPKTGSAVALRPIWSSTVTYARP